MMNDNSQNKYKNVMMGYDMADKMPQIINYSDIIKASHEIIYMVMMNISFDPECKIHKYNVRSVIIHSTKYNVM